MILIDEFSSTTLVSLPIVNRSTNRVAHKQVTLYVNLDPCIVAHVSTSVPAVNIWCAHTTNHSIDCCYGKQYSQISKCFLFPSSATDNM
jgi:hypothetical protein